MGVVIPGRIGNESFARAVSGPYQRCDDNCWTVAQVALREWIGPLV